MVYSGEIANKEAALLDAVATKVVNLNGSPFKIGKHTLIFTHIPKCGGTSIHSMLSGLLLDRYHHFNGKPADIDMTRLVGAGGHQMFGKNRLSLERDNLVYITVIREPLERFVSFYRHVQDHPEHHLHMEVPGLWKMSPLAFAKALNDIGNVEISNLQSRMLAPGLEGGAAAAHVRSNYSIIGLNEAMDRFVSDLRAMFPNFHFDLPRENVSTAERPELDSETVDFVRSINERDAALYEDLRPATP